MLFFAAETSASVSSSLNLSVANINRNKNRKESAVIGKVDTREAILYP